MEKSSIMNQVIILFLIVGVGYYSRKRNIINDEINKGLTKLLLEVTMPLMIVASFDYSFSKELMKNIIYMLLYSSLIHGALILISRILYNKYSKEKKDILRFATVFSNCGFMGFPVVGSIFGKIGILYASIFNIPYNILSWTFGIMLYTENKDSKNLKKVLLNPGIIAVIIGIILFIFSIKIPQTIYSTIKLVGDITTPLSMIIVGVMIAEVDFKKIFKKSSLYYIAFVRLILVPILTFAILKIIRVEELLIDVAIVIEAMPAAAVTAIFAEAYSKEPELASEIVFFTTFLSVVSIPVIFKILNIS
ncbi:putative transporter YfdV [Clostridium homopropionicum DSM 5847]|uniref:Putative transporter YfdV n=1 Tax=Clostridium homopropionicum DSM 5847 TaxID=1121318 RepID=A0A0L6ZFC1_9CLOT|nr:AEC family transporter [Clostridium homopropionicum]KOA21483.1 putative transporter YfdV [Clostridium homopropionicum DSM 5847]SFG08257.1 hypothetical protein SAMN04488501_10567 [Clostridium homopropionicum]